MARSKATTVEEYIEAAPPAAHDHLHQLRAILKSVAPHAEETIKWGTPFFIEPRYLFSFSAHKNHCNFAPSEEVIAAFSAELEGHPTTKNYLQMPHDQPIPEELVRKLAEYRLDMVNARDDDSFW